jgi:hypothetical protein
MDIKVWLYIMIPTCKLHKTLSEYLSTDHTGIQVIPVWWKSGLASQATHKNQDRIQRYSSIWHTNWQLRTEVLRSVVSLTIISGTCMYFMTILDYLDVKSPAQTFFPCRILQTFWKMVLSHPFVASQATSRSHHVFGTICSNTMKSISIMLHVAHATRYLGIWMASGDPQVNKQGIAGKM